MSELNIKLRDINGSDLEKIMEWRMSPHVTKFMYTDPKLDIDTQKKWLESIRSDISVKYWLIEINDTPAGIINLADIDWEAGTTSWGYYIAERKLRSLQAALSLEMSLYDYVFDTLKFNEIHGEIFSFNEGVIKLHEACGSKIVRIGKNEVKKNGRYYDVIHMIIDKDTWFAIRETQEYQKINFNSGGGVKGQDKEIDFLLYCCLMSNFEIKKVSNLRTERLLLKEICAEDTNFIVRMRSNPDVYKFFLSPHKITVKEHLEWFINSYLIDVNRVDWIAFFNNIKIGIFGVKKSSENPYEAEISYIIDTKFRGKGYAREAVNRLIEFCVKEWKIKTVVANIHKLNTESLKFAKGLGFEIKEIDGNFICYKKNL